MRCARLLKSCSKRRTRFPLRLEALEDRTVPSTIGETVPRGSDLLPDLTVDTINGLSDWFLSGKDIRFSQATPNIGDGPLELRGGALQPDGTQQVFQRIYETGGGHHDRTAGLFAFHPGHGHIHFEGYSEYNLRQALPDADGDGVPEVGDVAASSGKISFCLINVAVFDDMLPNFDPDGGAYTCGRRQGISVGWEDIYDASLPGQSINISDVSPGDYWLEAIVDPENRLVEKDETNNVGRVLLTIPRNEPPRVVNVLVKSTGSNERPFPIPVGSGVQVEPLPRPNLNQIRIRFSEDVIVRVHDLNLRSVQSFRYDPGSFTAIWTFRSMLPARAIRLTLSDRIHDGTGLVLDGEWDNPVDVNDPDSDTYPSGDGRPGGDFVFRFVVGSEESQHGEPGPATIKDRGSTFRRDAVEPNPVDLMSLFVSRQDRNRAWIGHADLDQQQS